MKATHTPEETGQAAVRATFVGPRADNVEVHISREELATIATAAAHYDRLHSGHAAMLAALESLAARHLLSDRLGGAGVVDGLSEDARKTAAAIVRNVLKVVVGAK